jgi:hypothetical protein
MKNADFTEPWTAMQKMFLPTPVILAPLRENACRFWESQEKVLDSMQALANLSGAMRALTKHARPQGVSELGRRSIRANNGRWPFVPATNHGGNRRARIAAISAFDNRKGGRAPAIRVEVSSALQDYVIGVLRKVTRMSAMGH